MSFSRRPLLVLLLGAVVALAVAVPSSSADGTSICPGATGAVAMTVTANPSQVSPSAPGRPSYSIFTVTVENCSPATKNGAVLDVGMAIASVEGDCTLVAGTCSFGTLRAGDHRHATLSVVAPTAGTASPDSVLRYADESNNGQNPEDPSQLVIVTAPLSLDLPEGEASTWVPADTGATLFSSKDGQTALVEVPAGQATGFTAKLSRDAVTPFACSKKDVCRTGPWFKANVNEGAPIEGGLTHTLTWPASQVDRKQTLRNLVVWHMLDSGEITELRACKSQVIDCIVDAELGADRTLTAVVRTATNGLMR